MSYSLTALAFYATDNVPTIDILSIARSSSSEFSQQDFYQRKNTQSLYLSGFDTRREELLRVWMQPIQSSPERYVFYGKQHNFRLIVDYVSRHIEFELLKSDANNRLADISGYLLPESIGDWNYRFLLRHGLITLFSLSEGVIEQQKAIKPAILFAEIDSHREQQLSAVDRNLLLSRHNKQSTQRKIEANIKERKRRLAMQLNDTQVSKYEAIQRHKVVFPPYFWSREYALYLDHFRFHADLTNVELGFLLAISQVETGFNPVSKYAGAAYGIMQVSPHSAGLIVSELVFRRATLPTADALYVAAVNIFYGTNYLSALVNTTFSDIKDRDSRLLCAVTAYKIGLDQLLKVFEHPQGDIEGFNRKINMLSRKQVFRQLVRDLPYKEAQQFVIRVMAATKAMRLDPPLK
ncbi:transglycosylase SLT domain-containing protein [Veronia nyctiphanis]|nr:transglycosylase SLT domain-containing protein [Veronia nyctiphanis]